MSAPKEITVKRWVCSGVGCTRSYSKSIATLAHMATCWKVPENKACMSCSHFMVYANDYGGERSWTCAVGIHLEPGKPVVGCEKWSGSLDRESQA